MALIAANSSRIAGVNRLFSGVTTVAGGHRRENVGVPHTHLNFAAGEHAVADVTNRSSVPQGARHPVAYKFARKAGGLASRNECRIEVTNAASGALGRNIAGDTSITFTLPDAQLQLVVSASGTATITLTTAGNLAGALYAEGSTTVTFTVGSSLLGAVAGLTGNATVTVSSTALATAIGHLAGDIVPYTELSPQALAQAVWNAVAADSNEVGTMGEKLNDAGSGSNPWTEVIEGGLTAAEILRILASVAAGRTTITDNGDGTATVEFVGLDDATTRVTAEMTGSDRTTMTLDGT